MKKGSRIGDKYLNNRMIANVAMIEIVKRTVLSKVKGFEKKLPMNDSKKIIVTANVG